jgi:hypothetical protein
MSQLPSSFPFLKLLAEQTRLHFSLSSHPARFPLLPRTAHMPFPAESPFFPLRLSKQHGPCSPLTPSRSQTQAQRTKPNKGTSTELPFVAIGRFLLITAISVVAVRLDGTGLEPDVAAKLRSCRTLVERAAAPGQPDSAVRDLGVYSYSHQLAFVQVSLR